MHTLMQLSNISNGISTLLPCVHPPLTLDVFIHVHYFVSAVDLYIHVFVHSGHVSSKTTVNINYHTYIQIDPLFMHSATSTLFTL